MLARDRKTSAGGPRTVSSPVRPATEASRVPDDASLLKMLYYMKLTRSIETRIERKLYRQGKIVGGVYVGRGQEAISVGAAMHIRRGGGEEVDDIVSPSHLGDSIPVAAGCALTFRQRGTDQVSFCFFGEGATSRGDWHEGVNFAAVQRLPVVFLCNNNQYAYSTPASRQMAVEHLSDRARGYGIPGSSHDGNDVLEVYDAVGRAVARAREGAGPTLLEFLTFRMTGHSAHDDAGYVPRGLFEEWAKKDPIDRLTAHLLNLRLVDHGAIREMEARIEAELDEAVAWAERQPYPDPAECLEGIYKE